MAIMQETHWDNVGTEPGAGDAEYVAGQQPIAEHDNWFNWSAAKDVENLISALENITTGHDHDGVNSKVVDGSDVVNTPAGDLAATTVQDALNELDTEKLAQQTIGIADNNLVEIDSPDAANGEYAKFTANGLESKTFAELRSDINVADGAEVTNAANIASSIVGSASKSSPVDADTIPLIDSEDSNSLKELEWGVFRGYTKLSDTHAFTTPLIGSPTGVWVLAETLTFTHVISGTFTLSNHGANTGGNNTSWLQYRKNGVQIGIDEVIPNLSEDDYSQNITTDFEVGDTLEVWQKVSVTSANLTTTNMLLTSHRASFGNLS